MMHIHQNAGFMIKKIHDAIDKVANKMLKEEGITLSQSNLLLFLSGRQNEKTTQKDIEQFFSVSHPTVIGLIRRLAKKGLIDICTDQTDARMRNVSLTEDANKIIARLDLFIQSSESRLLDNLSTDEQHELKRLLSKVLHNLE